MNFESTSSQPHFNLSLNLTLTSISTSTSTIISTQYSCDIKATQSCCKYKTVETVFDPYVNPKNSSLGPQKVKNAPKLSQNQMSELKQT